MQNSRVRYMRPSLRRYSLLESIAESSASSLIIATPPSNSCAPRRATVTSFCVNVPVHQRPSRNDEGLAQCVTKGSNTLLQPKGTGPEAASLTKKAPTRLAPPPSAKPGSRTLRLSLAAPNYVARKRHSLFAPSTTGLFAHPTTTSRQPPLRERADKTAEKQASVRPIVKPSVRKVPTKVSEDSIPSYARQTAASKAKITTKRELRKKR